MGPIVVLSLLINGIIMLHYLLLPNTVEFTTNMSTILMASTVVFLFSMVGFAVWISEVREFYETKQGPIATLIKIVTFPLWLIGMLLFAWSAYEDVKGIRNWMHKND